MTQTTSVTVAEGPVAYISEEEIDRIFKEVQSFSINLSSDPSVLGPEYLQELTVKIRTNVNRVTFHLNEMTHRNLTILRALNALKALHKAQSNELLTTNESVRKQKSIKDREAVINVLLHDLTSRIDSLEQQKVEVDTVLVMLRHVHKELKDSATDLRNQVKIIEVELRTKAHFGSDWDGVGKTPEENRKFREETESFLAEFDPSSSP